MSWFDGSWHCHETVNYSAFVFWIFMLFQIVLDSRVLFCFFHLHVEFRNRLHHIHLIRCENHLVMEGALPCLASWSSIAPVGYRSSYSRLLTFPPTPRTSLNRRISTSLPADTDRTEGLSPIPRHVIPLEVFKGWSPERLPDRCALRDCRGDWSSWSVLFYLSPSPFTLL